MSLDTLIVIVVVSAAAFFFIRSLYRTVTGKNKECGCGCSGCSKTECSDFPRGNRIH
ncbi:MAG: FeoB-associated Cys-rich membrane protein [Desulfobacterales bacterium]|nr:FeoB-associated Cys-rich membrane protein [Desulfobacterales bacterium]